MALIECAECGKEVSSLAVACPNCGCPAQQATSELNLTESKTNQGQEKSSGSSDSDKGCAVALLAGIAVAFILGLSLTTCNGEPNDSQSSAEDIAKSITEYCANEAGIPVIPADSPRDHAISPSEMSKFTTCVDKQMYGK